jgi:putative tricarboxylic transport membrane protein
MKMGGTGAKQEDQIITVAIEQQTGAKFTYIPYKGGGRWRRSWSAATSTRR